MGWREGWGKGKGLRRLGGKEAAESEVSEGAGGHWGRDCRAQLSPSAKHGTACRPNSRLQKSDSLSAPLPSASAGAAMRWLRFSSMHGRPAAALASPPPAAVHRTGAGAKHTRRRRQAQPPPSLLNAPRHRLGIIPIPNRLWEPRFAPQQTVHCGHGGGHGGTPRVPPRPPAAPSVHHPPLPVSTCLTDPTHTCSANQALHLVVEVWGASHVHTHPRRRRAVRRTSTLADKRRWNAGLLAQFGTPSDVLGEL